MSNIGERRAVRRLVRHLKANGWIVRQVDNGEELIDTPREADIIEHVFSVDDSCIVAFNAEGRNHRVYIVLGNAADGSEIVCDYGFSDGDPDGFDATMTAFV